MKFKDNKISWTDERISLLKRMWKEGKSAADIAKTLGKGVTRNAVIGKAHRMGLSGRPSPIKKPVEAPKKAAAPAAKKDVKTVAKEAVKPAPRPAAAPAGKKPLPVSHRGSPLMRDAEAPKAIEKDVIPPGGGVALIDLTERMCKWPIGDPREPEFTFCGLGIRQGTPYCPGHAAAAYQTSSRNRNAAAVVHVAVEVEVEVEDKDEPADVAEDDEVEAAV